MNINWPVKAEREQWQIQHFLCGYKLLPHGRTFEVVSKGERPDYIVIDRITSEKFGVELTSVYLDDRSVPDEHMVRHERLVDIPFDQAKLDEYKQRLIGGVRVKVKLARRGYDITRPLILSLYVNEYTALFMVMEDFEELTRDNEEMFVQMTPFVEVVYWIQQRLFSVRPNAAGSLDTIAIHQEP